MTTEKYEEVDHPAHYGGPEDPHEHCKCATSWGLHRDAFLYNASKYLCRAGRKPGVDAVTDLRKAIRYIEMSIEHRESQKIQAGGPDWVDVKQIIENPDLVAKSTGAGGSMAPAKRVNYYRRQWDGELRSPHHKLCDSPGSPHDICEWVSDNEVKPG